MASAQAEIMRLRAALAEGAAQRERVTVRPVCSASAPLSSFVLFLLEFLCHVVWRRLLSLRLCVYLRMFPQAAESLAAQLEEDCSVARAQLREREHELHRLRARVEDLEERASPPRIYLVS